jgi:hypothetical protein
MVIVMIVVVAGGPLRASSPMTLLTRLKGCPPMELAQQIERLQASQAPPRTAHQTPTGLHPAADLREDDGRKTIIPLRWSIDLPCVSMCPQQAARDFRAFLDESKRLR